MIKRKAIYTLVGGLLITGLMLNAPSMSAYVENFGATQTITAANWDAKVEYNLKDHTILPGQTISEDTITLENKNNYPVEFTINLSSEGSELKDILQLTITDQVGQKIRVEAGDSITLNSNVKWPDGTNDIQYKEAEVKYTYEITAESVKEVTPEGTQE